MTDSAIAVATFGSGKAVLATDYSAGAHSPKVTTNAASDGIAISGFGGGKHVVGTVKSGGVHTLCVTTGAANDAIALPGARGEKVVIGTVLSGGAHTIAVTTGAANSSVAIAGFGSDIIRLATVLNAGVHTLAVSTSGNGGFAIAGFGADKTVFASAGAGGTHSVTVSGLASYDLQAAAYFANAHITDSARMGRLNTFIVDLKAALGIANLADRFDYIYFRASPPDLPGALIDATGNGFNGTALNSPTQTTGVGVQSNGSTSYIKNNFNPSTQAVRYTLRNASVFSYVSSLDVASGVSAGCAVGVNQAVNAIIYPHWTSDRFLYALNNAGGGTQVSNTTAQTGLFALDLADASPDPKVTPYLDGVALATAAAQNTTNLPGADLSSLANNQSDSSRVDFFKGVVAWEACGGHFTAAEHAAISVLVSTLATGGW